MMVELQQFFEQPSPARRHRPCQVQTKGASILGSSLFGAAGLHSRPALCVRVDFALRR
jgi:hypothetical protein